MKLFFNKVSSIRDVVFLTKTKRSCFFFTSSNPTFSYKSIHNNFFVLFPVYNNFFRMIFRYMLRVVYYQHKIFYPIIRSIMIYVVNHLRLFKSSSKMFFHNMPMFLNSFFTIPDVDISLSFYWKFCRNCKNSISPPPTIMFVTQRFRSIISFWSGAI